MICDRAELAVVSEPLINKPFYARPTAKLDGTLLDQNDYKISTDLTTTKSFEFSITYKPRYDLNSRSDKPFIVICDRVGPNRKSRYKDWNDFCEIAKKNSLTSFVKEWSTITAEYFDLAEANKGCVLPFGMDWVRYNNHLREEYKKEYGEYPPPDATLLSYRVLGEASAESYAEYKQALYDRNVEVKLAANKANKKKGK